jgi:hypothetical protein
MHSKTITQRADMSGQEVLSLYAQGYQVLCRYCKVPFITQPEFIPIGEAPQFVACPENPNHFTLLTEPADRMQEMRKRMNARRNEP